MIHPDQLKEEICRTVDALADELEAISHRIHASPELCYQEEKASAWLSEFLEHNGLAVERGTGGISTAFRATVPASSPGPTIAILAEYDALPEIGHACGHNVIAASGVGAGAALVRALKTLPVPGSVQVIGTPAEEGGAGKVRLLEAGVFKGVDAALMIHPRCGTQIWRPTLGVIKVTVGFRGKAAHASSAPWQGVNALNAVIQLFVSLDALRQQVRPDARIHGIITRGGDQPNIIPERTAAAFYLRSENREYLDELLRRFKECAEGAATATGCGATIAVDPVIHEPLKPNLAMAALFEKNLARIDFSLDPDDGQTGYGSTDAGNLSQAIPMIHPYIRISPDGIPGHSREFAEWAKSAMARGGLVAAAKVLAMTALDLLASPEELKKAKAEFASGR